MGQRKDIFLLSPNRMPRWSCQARPDDKFRKCVSLAGEKTCLPTRGVVRQWLI